MRCNGVVYGSPILYKLFKFVVTVKGNAYMVTTIPAMFWFW